MSSFDPLCVESLIQQVKDDREEFFTYIDPQIRQIVKKLCARLRVLEFYEEILGAVYENVVQGFDRFEGSTWNELKTWLYKTAYHAGLNFITRTLGKAPPKLTATLEDEADFVDRGTADIQKNIHERIDLLRVLETLDPLEGFILMLHSSFEYTFDEIGRIAKLPSYKARRVYINAVKGFQNYESRS